MISYSCLVLTHIVGTANRRIACWGGGIYKTKKKKERERKNRRKVKEKGIKCLGANLNCCECEGREFPWPAGRRRELPGRATLPPQGPAPPRGPPAGPEATGWTSRDATVVSSHAFWSLSLSLSLSFCLSLVKPSLKRTCACFPPAIQENSRWPLPHPLPQLSWPPFPLRKADETRKIFG